MPTDELISVFAPLLPLLAAPYIIWHLLMAWPLFAIAGQRGLWWRWLAWLPIGQNYILGAIADDLASARGYRLYHNGEEYRRESYFRYILSGYQILLVFAGALIAVRVWQGAGLPPFLASEWFGNLREHAWPVISFALTGVHAWCLYKIFCYYRADRASLYTFLCAILVVPTPFLLISLRREFPRKPNRRGGDDRERTRPS